LPENIHLIQAKLIVTNPSRGEDCVKEGAIAVHGETILAIAPIKQLQSKYPDAPIIGSDHHLALPGFVDPHNHGQGLTTFSQGLMDDKLELWSIKYPRLLDKPGELSYLDALIAAGKQIRSGVTTTMPKRMDAPPLPLPEYEIEVRKTIQAYNDAGLRLTFAMGTTDKASNLVYLDNQEFMGDLPEDARRAAQELLSSKAHISLSEVLDLLDSLHSEFQSTDMTAVAVAITGPQWISDEFLIPLGEKALALGIPLHGPMLESVHQKLYAQQALGETVLEHLDQLGFLHESFSLAHGVWMTDRDMELLAAAGGTVIHCPSSNLRMHGGIAPLKRMLELGLNVGLAVDSEGINDDDDTFQEMRLASLLHRIPGPGKTPDPWDLLAMATINGAKALGRQDQIGSLEPGKKADLVLADMHKLAGDGLDSEIDPIQRLILRGKPEAIDLVMINGEVVYQDGRHTRFDFDAARAELKELLQSADWSSGKRRAELVNQLLPHVRAYYDAWQPEGLAPYYLPNART